MSASINSPNIIFVQSNEEKLEQKGNIFLQAGNEKILLGYIWFDEVTKQPAFRYNPMLALSGHGMLLGIMKDIIAIMEELR